MCSRPTESLDLSLSELLEGVFLSLLVPRGSLLPWVLTGSDLT